MKPLLFLLALLVFAPIQAQDNQPRPQRQPPTIEQVVARAERKSQKWAERWQLDATRTARFETLYVDSLKAMHAILTPVPPLETPDQQPTDAEIEARILARFKMGHDILRVREEYYHKLREVLTPRQLHAIYEAEQRNMQRIHNKDQQKADSAQGKGKNNPRNKDK